ncbi:MAG: hypothetical protein Q8N73_02155 [bacterium]|nr:hypothetical protein [bacterium]
MKDLVESIKEFGGVDRIWERVWEKIKTERPDLSQQWLLNVRKCISNLPLRCIQSLLLSIAHWFLETNGGEDSPKKLVGIYLYHVGYKDKFSVSELENLFELDHYLKAI